MQKLIISLLLLLILLTAHTSLPEDSLLVPTDSYGIVIEGVTIVPGIITEGEPGHIEFKPWKPEKFKGSGELEKQWEISFEKEYLISGITPYKEGWFVSEKLINPENCQELDIKLHPKSKLELAEIDYENELILTWDYGFHKNLILHDFDGNIRWKTRLVAGAGFEPVFIGENIYGIHKSGIWKINTSTGITQWCLSLGKSMYGDFISSDKYVWIKRRNNQYFRIDPEIPEVLEYNLEDMDDLFVYDENVYIITRQEYFYNTDQELGVVISKIDMCANSSEKDCNRRHYEESPYNLYYYI
ncbi:MAG: hypothetical protein KAH30_00235, partial [Caldisericia bacterium]|nr:hypothetical protein [Caldisericia bacterium]